ncbi:MAG: NADH:flavin oxidoreductase [Anaerolineae bacterium]|nr:NADH:flavin oxidoreductase [Anaerolineae bacterium]
MASMLFEPLAVGTMELANRTVRSATAEYLSDEEGRPLPELADMHCALARGGVGLIITGHAYVDRGGRCRVQMSGMHDDVLIPDWAALVARVHEAGGVIAAQINHGARQCDPAAVGGPLVAPSPLSLSDDAPRPEELTEREIRNLLRAFADASGRVKAAGFDAVQVHAAHGYLINLFNSPASNWRRDAWGGTFPRRVRFLEEVATAVRDVVGDDYPVLIKLGAIDFVRDGLTEEDGIEIIRHLRDMGFDALEISGGINVGRGGSMRGGIDSPEKEAYFLPIARRARAVTDLPILLVGGMRSRDVIDRVLDEGSADMISFSRPLIREPDLPNRLRDGQPAATCISCNQCWPRAGELGISCHYGGAEEN